MLTALTVAAALLCWPSAGPAARLRALSGSQRRRWLYRPGGRFAEFAAVVAVAFAGFCVLGVAGAVVGGVLAAIGLRRLRVRRLAAARVAATRAVADAVGALVAELRAGAHPAVAADAVASDAQAGAPAAALGAIAAAARLGGDLDVALADVAATDQPGSAALRRVARAWTLAQRHGLPLAEVLDAVRRDLDAGARFAAQSHAKLAGPRASATVLACLPAVGVLLGEAMGARPLGVLAGTGAGQFLLLLGGLLIAGGVAWSGRLTRMAVPT